MALDLITIELYLLAVVAIILILICGYRAIKNFDTDMRMSSIYFFLIWIFAIVVVIFGLGGKNAPFASSTAEFLLKLGESFSIGVLLSMTLFANTILYDTIYNDRKALLITFYTAALGIIILSLFWMLPTTFLILPEFALGGAYNEITYTPYQFLITIMYFPMIFPIWYVFINMVRVDPDNKKKYWLYLIGFIFAIVELAFDMPGTLPELLFVWRLFALISMCTVIVALLIPRAE